MTPIGVLVTGVGEPKELLVRFPPPTSPALKSNLQANVTALNTRKPPGVHLYCTTPTITT
jgi:hypothetical protein